MGDLAAMIMSMDTLQLGGIGLATMGSIGLLAYAVLKKKSSKDDVERASALTDAALKPRIERANTEEGYTVNTQEELSHLRPRLTENTPPAPEENPVADLIESALVYDGYGSKDEAGQMLREAMEHETHAKEKVRLHVIYKNYMAGSDALSELLERYPTFIKKQLVVDTEQHRSENKEQIDLFASKKDIMPVEQIIEEIPAVEEVKELENEQEVVAEKISNTVNDFNSQDKVEPTLENVTEVIPIVEDDIPVLTDEIVNDSISFADIKKESDLIDEYRQQDEEQAASDFFKEFGSLAQQIQQENKEAEALKKGIHIPSPVISSVEKEIFDVWANYMSLFGGRMNLKNTFIHLDNAWGTIAGIAELQEKINHEIGTDGNGNQNPWAIISVLPLKVAEYK